MVEGEKYKVEGRYQRDECLLQKYLCNINDFCKNFTTAGLRYSPSLVNVL